jgi:aspartate-semialdehyde dehydrogenase
MGRTYRVKQITNASFQVAFAKMHRHHCIRASFVQELNSSGVVVVDNPSALRVDKR